MSSDPPGPFRPPPGSDTSGREAHFGREPPAPAPFGASSGPFGAPPGGYVANPPRGPADPQGLAVVETLARENEASALTTIQRLEGVRKVFVLVALGLLVVTLIAAKSMSPILLVGLVLLRTIAWGACGLICVAVGVLLGRAGRPSGGSYLNAAIYFVVALLPFLQIFSAFTSSGP